MTIWRPHRSAVPSSRTLPGTANDRFRAAAGLRRAAALAGSLALHLVVLGALALVAPGPPARAEREVRLVELPPVAEAEREPRRGVSERPPTVSLPRPREPIPRPGRPVPTPEVAAGAPEWIPHDVPPRLLNPSRVRSLLEDRSWDIEERGERVVVLWLFVERTGDVTRLRMERSSGLVEIDAAAREVAGAMRFRPALFKGRNVAVWIAQPIRFHLRLADASPPPREKDGRR